MIQARGVGFRYAGYEQPSLVNINFEAKEGDLVLLKGANGSGKSTLLRCLAGLMPQFYPGECSGELLIDGSKAFQNEPRTFFGVSALVGQEPRSQAFCSDLFHEMAFGVRNLGLSEKEVSYRVHQTAERLGLVSFLSTPVRKLSGGRQKLALLACYLALHPKVLLLDEPFANLDNDVSQLLVQVLAAEKANGTTVVISEHQSSLLLPLINHTLELSLPPLISPEVSPPACSWKLMEAKRFPSWTATNCQIDRGESTVFEALNFELSVPPGIVLKGKNGAGKTTLLKALRGLIKPSKGSLDFQDKPLKGYRISALTSSLGYAGQDPEQQFFCLTVHEELEASAYLGKKFDKEWLGWLSDQFLLTPLANRSPYHLSGGEQRRLALATSLSAAPEIVLWDEPVAGLDAESRQHLGRVILCLQEQGLGVMISAHDDSWPLKRQVLLHDGKVDL